MKYDLARDPTFVDVIKYNQLGNSGSDHASLVSIRKIPSFLDSKIIQLTVCPVAEYYLQQLCVLSASAAPRSVVVLSTSNETRLVRAYPRDWY